jgi:16S rRNA (guanine966-N2)-methyltransferase
MRVVAGTLSGRRLVAPPSGRGPATTRPTTDKVREAVFNALQSRHGLDGLTVVDLFAGSGALGIEALSRGADRCTFVERDRRAVEALRRNLDQLRLGDRSTVVVGDVMARAASLPSVDLVLADPPYDFDDWPSLLAAVEANALVAESDRPIEGGDRWQVERTRAYGRTWVTWLHRVP